MHQLPVVLRPPRETDLAFVLDCWVRVVGTDEGFCHAEPRQLWKHLRPALERALYDSDVVVASNNDDLDHICGWACAGWADGKRILHYMYVKKPFRGFGLSHLLTKCFLQPGEQYLVSFWSRNMGKLPKKAKYWPFKIWSYYASSEDIGVVDAKAGQRAISERSGYNGRPLEPEEGVTAVPGAI